MGFFDLFSSSDKAKAKKIFEIYKEIRGANSEATNKQPLEKYKLIYRTTLNYLRSSGMAEGREEYYSELVSEHYNEFKDLKAFARHVLSMEEYASQSLSSLGGFLRSERDLDKFENRTNAIEEAYREVFEK